MNFFKQINSIRVYVSPLASFLQDMFAATAHQTPYHFNTNNVQPSQLMCVTLGGKSQRLHSLTFVGHILSFSIYSEPFSIMFIQCVRIRPHVVVDHRRANRVHFFYSRRRAMADGRHQSKMPARWVSFHRIVLNRIIFGLSTGLYLDVLI